MGNYTFKWEHPASEVFVTGTFDDWGKTVKLEKKGGIFEKTVDLPDSKKVLYKFVADGNWTTNSSAAVEDDGHGNKNNVLTVEDTKKSEPSTISSAAPTSTTAALAGAVPKESKPITTSSAAPESTTAQLAGQVPKESNSEGAPTISSAAPESTTAELAGQQPKQTPGIGDVPGGFPETPSQEQTFSVNPIPATSGTGNPIHLEPGEKVPDPSTITSNTVESTAKDDPELKAKGTGAKENGEQAFGVAPIPATEGLGNPIHLKPGEKVPDPSTITSNTVESTAKTDPASYEASDAAPPSTSKAAGEAGAFGVPPVTNNMIPESSLPMGDKAGNADTKDSGPTIQSAAPESTTAALAGQVPKEPRGVPEVVSESQKEANVSPEASANPEAVAEKKAVEQELEGKAINTMNAASITGSAGTSLYSHEAATAVPPVVEKSLEQANRDPEAAANPEAVAEKAAVEHELEKKVPVENEAGEPAPTESAALSAEAPNTKPSGLKSNSLAPEETLKSSSEPEVKPPVSLQSVPPSGEPTDLNASADKPAQSVATETGQLASEDVSPMTQKTEDQTQPTVTTGTGTANAPAEQKAEPSTPSKKGETAQDTPQSAKSGDSAKEDKKKKRRSFFGKLKDKLKG